MPVTDEQLQQIKRDFITIGGTSDAWREALIEAFAPITEAVNGFYLEVQILAHHHTRKAHRRRKMRAVVRRIRNRAA